MGAELLRQAYVTIIFMRGRLTDCIRSKIQSRRYKHTSAAALLPSANGFFEACQHMDIKESLRALTSVSEIHILSPRAPSRPRVAELHLPAKADWPPSLRSDEEETNTVCVDCAAPFCKHCQSWREKFERTYCAWRSVLKGFVPDSFPKMSETTRRCKPIYGLTSTTALSQEAPCC